MANATVEKLKVVGLKHGEKAVVGLAVTLFLLFVVMAITRKTIELKPEELQKKAESADSNLSQRQKNEDILAKLESLGVKPKTEFEETVEKQQSKALDPGAYVVKSKWVTPEPGAGLIRGQPELLAPTDLYAFPNRGGYLVYALNAKGDRIPEDDKTKEKTKKPRLGKPRKKRGGMGMMSSSGSAGSAAGMGMMGGELTQKQKDAAEKKRLEDSKILEKSLVGKVDDTSKKADEKTAGAAAAAGPEVDYKEITKGFRSVVITSTLDNKTLRANYLAALKTPELGYPNYKRVDVQRQTLGPDGKWSEFKDVDSNKNLDVLDNLPELDEELVPLAPGPRLEALVDPLPFPKAGYWGGVHIAKFVPKDKREIPKAAPGGMGPGGMMSMPGMSSSGMAGDSSMGGGMGGSKAMGMMSSSGPGMMGSGMMGPGMMGGSAAGSSGPVDDTTFQKSEADEVMVRTIDFTVDPDATYRFRQRIVVVNPNWLRGDVSPGVDTDSEELKGPWSEASNELTVPADVAAYAMEKFADQRRNDQIRFQVVRWNPEDGHTVVRSDVAGPGEMIGNYAGADVPSSDGTGKKNVRIDFNSRQIVLDSMGGSEPVPSGLKGVPAFPVPAVSLAMRPDGIVTVHSQARDVPDEVRIEMDSSYKRAIKDSSKKREPGMGGMGSSSMGSGSGMSR